MTTETPSGRATDSTHVTCGDRMTARVRPERSEWSLPAARRTTGHRVSLTLTAEPQAARAARAFAGEACVQWGLQAVQDSVVLVVSELVTNVVVHTQSSVAPVHLELQSGRLLIEVEDTESRVPSKRDGRQDDTSGRGISLVDSMCSHWGSRATLTGKVVWAHLPLAQAEPAVGRCVHHDA